MFFRNKNGLLVFSVCWFSIGEMCLLLTFLFLVHKVVLINIILVVFHVQRISKSTAASFTNFSRDSKVGPLRLGLRNPAVRFAFLRDYVLAGMAYLHGIHKSIHRDLASGALKLMRPRSLLASGTF